MKSRGRFICDHQLRLFYHCGSDQNPPCHSTGKFKGIHIIHFFIKTIPCQSLPAFFQADPVFTASYLLSHFHQWVQIRHTLWDQNDLIDVVMGIPHILLLLLISFALGKGLKGVAVGIILTHWTSLTRLIRGEVLQLRESHFIKIAEKMGMSPWQIGIRHMMPHLLPQVLVGMVLMFPHAILHEASITFLGFGLSQEQPAIGVILSESMKYLTMGKWWLALFPGLLLVLVVIMFHVIGDTLNSLLDPSRAHE